jgi:hypothetical protein
LKKQILFYAKICIVAAASRASRKKGGKHFYSILINLVPIARVPFGQHRATRGPGRNDFLVRFNWFWQDNGNDNNYEKKWRPVRLAGLCLSKFRVVDVVTEIQFLRTIQK